MGAIIRENTPICKGAYAADFLDGAVEEPYEVVDGIDGRRVTCAMLVDRRCQAWRRIPQQEIKKENLRRGQDGEDLEKGARLCVRLLS